MQQSPGVVYAAPAAGVSGLPRASRLLVRWLIVALAALAAAGLVVALIPDRYTATTMLVLADGPGLAPVGDSPSAAGAIIASPDLAREVVTRLGPETQALQPRGFSGLARWLAGFGLLPGWRPPDDPTQAADTYMRSLVIEPRDDAGVLSLGVGAASADLAARTANMTAQVYLERRAAAVAERDQALAAAAEGMAKAQQDLLQAIDRAAVFRADPAAADTARRARTALADLSLLAAERAALAGERDAIARRLLSVEALRGSGNLFDAPFEGVHLLRHLVEQRLTLRADLAAERRIRAARDWRVRALTARADDLDSQIEAATGSARDTLAAERDQLDRRLSEVEAAIHLRQAIIAAAEDNDRRQRDLDHAIAAARDRLDVARERLRDDTERVRIGAAAARVLAVAEAPAYPDSGRPLVAGIAAGLLAAFLAWRLMERPVYPPSTGGAAGTVVTGGSTNAAGEAGDKTAEPARLADPADAVPAVAATLPTTAAPPLFSVRMDAAGDRALETLLARLAISPRDEGGRHVVVVGAEDAVGASLVVARALAEYLARRERIVLLDLATEGDAIGFTDLIAGRASFSEIITREPGSRLHRVARGQTAVDGGVIGDAAALALAALDQTYDWIIEVVPAGGGDAMADRLLHGAQGVVLVAGGDAMDMHGFAAYEALRKRGMQNIVVGLSG